MILICFESYLTRSEKGLKKSGLIGTPTYTENSFQSPVQIHEFHVLASYINNYIIYSDIMLADNTWMDNIHNSSHQS